ncbi:sensor histidine kinase [Solidesulfovibrio magneticus]|uniref:Two-component sensor histidine kinase n=1 Tax=Solidesulfovibrio magneticus (strain ATCC 700980 / DSM 13731 / RS-1) TaxID=573370 RepID=C4XMF3_SOLM1|nr:CHASE4 domain-containing protein [Solidesulfovibrio magneticus]BAH74910.1 two-component sensor histidine kinase [Solidesulfovibrio magneticus RS-1]
MSLRKTAAVIVCAVFFGLLLLLYAMFRGNIQSGFDGLERQAVTENLRRVQNALNRDLKNLEGMAADWGLWDDTYHYLQTGDDAYVEANLTAQSFGELRLDVLALYDASGRLQAARQYDATEGVLFDAAKPVSAMTEAAPGLLRLDAFEGRKSGLAFYEGQPCLIVAQTVLTSARQGPAAGTLIMAQMLDVAKVAAIAELTLLDVKLLPLTSQELPPGLTDALAADPDGGYAIRTPDATTVSGYALLRDIARGPALVLAVSMPRSIHQQGRLLERAMVGSLTTIGIMFGLAMLYFVERFILSRVTGLGQEIAQLGQGSRKRVTPLAGNDEVSALSRAVNLMLDELDAARAHYVMATRAAKVGVWELQPDAGLIVVDPVIAGLLGYDSPGQPEALALWLDRLAPEDRDSLVRPGQHLFDKPTFERELRVVAAQGGVLCFLCRGQFVPGADGSPSRLVATAVDITELKQAAESIRALSGRLMQAQESERASIARDLHDNVAQDLSSLKIAYETLLDGLADVDAALRQRLEAASGLLARTIASVRELAYGLRPPNLEHLGLDQALRRLSQEMGQASGLAVSYAGVGLEGLDVDADVAINLFRIAQEALANVRKHAGASRVEMRLIESYPKLILRIRDDGRGFDAVREHGDCPGEASRPCMGLINMRERAGLFGGSLRVISSPGHGTTVVAEVPYAGEVSHAQQTPAHR